MNNSILGGVLALVILSLAVLAIGLVLRRRGMLRTRPAALAWALLTVAPLFGGGLIFYLNHLHERAAGITRPGENTPPNSFAP